MLFFSLSACSKTIKKKVCFKNICITAEIADTDHARSRGLMSRSSLAPEEGMLFVFDKDVICGMWMKNMRFPLDMLWIDRNKKIVDIKKNVPACASRTSTCEVLTSPVYVRYVLEVSAGFADKYGVETGEMLDF